MLRLKVMQKLVLELELWLVLARVIVQEHVEMDLSLILKLGCFLFKQLVLVADGCA